MFLPDLTLLSLGCLLLLTLYFWVVEPLLVSPLARIPNAHWSAPLSRLWILRVRRAGVENRTLAAAHRRLGPVVRLGPQDVSIDDVDMVRTVYGGGFARTDWYAVFDNYGVPCMFSTGPGREHALRKRMISNVYSKSFVQSSAAATAQSKIVLLDRLLPLLQTREASHPQGLGLNVFPIFLSASMDAIAAYIFGLRCGTDFLGQPDYRMHWLRVYNARHGGPIYPQEMPQLTRFLRRFCGWKLSSPTADRADAELNAWNATLCDKATAFLNEMNHNQEDYPPEDEPVVLRAYLAGLEREKSAHGVDSILYDTALQHQRLSLQSELLDHVLAGQETTGIALTYMTWRLSQHPELQAELRRELATCDTSSSGLLPSPKAVDALPLLNAIVQETLRLHAPIAAPLPRQTPPGGCRVGPYALPGGVRIAAMAHSLHRDETVFPSPEKWDPLRWLEVDEKGGIVGNNGSEDARRARNRQFWAFSSGGRMCIGSLEMKMTAAMIYSRFTTHEVDTTGMEQTDGYTGRPCTESLHLRFVPLPDKTLS